MKIFIIQSAKLGDMVCTTPVFRAVKEKYPKARLIVAGNTINAAVVENNTDVDEYVVISNSIGSVYKQIKRTDPDLVISMTPFVEGLIAALISFRKKIIFPKIVGGYSPLQTLRYKILCLFVTTIPHKMGTYAPREYLKLLEPLDIFTENTKKYIYFSAQSKIKADNKFAEWGIQPDDVIVGISPAAGNKIKQWPAARFAKVADHIFEQKKAKVIIFGSKNDEKEVKEMISLLNPQTKIINAYDVFSIDELKVAISKLSLFVSVDTGPIYIAEALGIPTVDIIGPIDEHEQPPIGAQHKIVVPKDRIKPELYVMNARTYNEKEAIRQVESISVEDVLQSIYELL
jgi:ADP-heptose:LPS heptosyltransferase